MAGQHTFRRRHRIGLAADYRAAYEGRLRKAAGPLIVFARRNGRPEHRLGLAVGRHVGNAVARGRIKRFVREAFRLDRARYPNAHQPTASGGSNEPGGFDLVVRVRPHRIASLDDYRGWLADAAARIGREHAKRIQRVGGDA
jgi:ribonuclease P protein component